jgi:hypothetical protein
MENERPPVEYSHAHARTTLGPGKYVKSQAVAVGNGSGGGTGR